MAEETKPNPKQEQEAAEKSEAKEESAEAAPKAKASKSKSAKAKKEKKPAVEDKPFDEFIQQDFIPALKKAFAQESIADVELKLIQDKLPLPGSSQDEQCSQVVGNWKNGKRWFNLYFIDEDIKGRKVFTWASDGAQPSTVESFMIDERKVSLELLVMYTLQRLNAQKWLARN